MCAKTMNSLFCHRRALLHVDKGLLHADTGTLPRGLLLSNSCAVSQVERGNVGRCSNKENKQSTEQNSDIVHTWLTCQGSCQQKLCWTAYSQAFYKKRACCAALLSCLRSPPHQSHTIQGADADQVIVSTSCSRSCYCIDITTRVQPLKTAPRRHAE